MLKSFAPEYRIPNQLGESNVDSLEVSNGESRDLGHLMDYLRIKYVARHQYINSTNAIYCMYIRTKATLYEEKIHMYTGC